MAIIMAKKIFRILLLVISGLGFGIFFIPLPIYGIFNIGNIAGMLFFGAIFASLFFSEKLGGFIKRFTRKASGKAVVILFSAFILVCLTAAALSGAKIIKSAVNAPPETTKTTAVVLGCRVYDSGPSRMLWSRINAAYEYLLSNPDTVCILSGGQGEDEPISEAQSMFNELTKMGIAPERLIMEDSSESTRENLAFSLEIIKEKSLPEELTLITNEYHQCRAAMIAKDLGCKAYAVSAPSQKILLLTYFAREIFGVIYETVKTL
ncbi:MAG: YdcF family protein [Oscillospiraceae bacterium]|nr:YdcF family protein [Oscillospiraceae bacterium]